MTPAPITTHGGARKGAGRKALLTGAKQHLLTLDAPAVATFKELGEGNLSAGARAAASIAATQKERAAAAPRTSNGMLLRMALTAAFADEAPQEEASRCGLMMVDPGQVSVHRCHGRHASAFTSPEFFELKGSIERTSGNRVPVLLSRRPDGRLELVYGRLRMQAVTDLGIPLLAIVRESTSVSAVDEVLDMAMESTGGNVPWSLYERGTLLQRCLELGYYPSPRRLAEHLRWSLADVATALKLVNYPPELIAAFESPRDIEQKWMVHLSAALDRDAMALLAAANALASTSARRSAKDVYSALKQAAVR